MTVSETMKMRASLLMEVRIGSEAEGLEVRALTSRTTRAPVISDCGAGPGLSGICYDPACLMRSASLPRLCELGFASYDDYLRSPHWLRLKARYKRSRRWQCVCGERKFLQLHHVTYERLGAERLEDLRPLCQTCHTLLHQLVDEGLATLDPDSLFSKKRARSYARERTDGRTHEPETRKAKPWDKFERRAEKDRSGGTTRKKKKRARKTSENRA